MFVVFLYFLHALSHSQGFKGYRQTKRKFHVIPWKLDIYKEKVLFWGSFQNYYTPDYPSFMSFIVTFASFLRISSTSLRAFPPLVFLLHDFANRVLSWIGVSAASSFLGSDSLPVWYRLDFESWILATFYCRFLYFFASGNSLRNVAIK